MSSPHDLPSLLATALPGVSWPTSLWPRLLPLAPPRRCAAGAVVVAQGQPRTPLCGVLSGEIEIRFVAADGGISVLEHTQPGQIFGLASFVADHPATYEAVATQATRLAVFSEAAYVLLMDTVPGFGRALMAEFARRHHGTMRMLAAARHQSAMERLTLALGQLRTEQPDAVVDGTGAVGLRTTQAALAERAGLSRQTVNELLAQLVQQARVRCAYGRLWLLP
jgi:CRP-like cAMP-binding protein